MTLDLVNEQPEAESENPLDHPGVAEVVHAHQTALLDLQVVTCSCQVTLLNDVKGEWRHGVEVKFTKRHLRSLLLGLLFIPHEDVLHLLVREAVYLCIVWYRALQVSFCNDMVIIHGVVLDPEQLLHRLQRPVGMLHLRRL